MEIGISSACFYPDIKLEDSIKTMKSLGFNTGEIFLNCPSEMNEGFIDILLKEKIENNFNINSIHAFSSFFEPYIFDVYKRRREDMIKYFKEVCIAGKKLGAKFYTFHGGRKKEKGTILNDDFIIDIYNELMYIAYDIGITIAQENVSWCMSSSIEFLQKLKEKAKYPIKFTLDIKQAYRAGVDIEKYIDVMGEDIVNLHINDVDKNNLCVMPGRGRVDYSKIFKKLNELKYNNVGIIEIYRDNYKEIDELQLSKINSLNLN